MICESLLLLPLVVWIVIVIVGEVAEVNVVTELFKDVFWGRVDVDGLAVIYLNISFHLLIRSSKVTPAQRTAGLVLGQGHPLRLSRYDVPGHCLKYLPNESKALLPLNAIVDIVGF